MKLTETDKGAHRSQQGSTQKSTREHTEVDKGTHRGQQGSTKDRQGSKLRYMYNRGHKGSQKQIREQSVADKVGHSQVAMHNNNSIASIQVSQELLIHGGPEIGEVSSRGLII